MMILAIFAAPRALNGQTAGESGPTNVDFGKSLAAPYKPTKKSKRVKSGSNSQRLIPVANVSAEPEETVRIDTTLVINDVRVLDKRGDVVSGLRASDFTISEDDSPQEISIFSLGGDQDGIPKSIILIIDYSFSQLPYIETSIDAAKFLVDKLNPRDRMAIVSDDVMLLTNFTTDRSLLKEKLENLKRSALSGKVGKSKQYCALMASIKELFREGDLRPIIIFQTDGDELMRLKRAGADPRLGMVETDNIGFSYKDVLAAAEGVGAVVYSVIPGTKYIGKSSDETEKSSREEIMGARQASAKIRNEKFEPDKMKVLPTFIRQWSNARKRDQLAIAEVASVTGGWAEHLETPEQADAVYSRILAGMNSRYVIGYYPSNQARDGSQRSIKIKIRGSRGYTIWGRQTYIAPLDPE